MYYEEGRDTTPEEETLISHLLEARAEIERLEKEVERLKRDKTNLHNTLEKVFSEAANQWNDAIEAAAHKAVAKLDKASQYRLSQSVADAIRALKRPTP